MIDLSHPLDPMTPVYPGDPRVRVELLDSPRWPAAGTERRLNSSYLSFGVHAGTHMDAPFHFFEDKPAIDRIEPDRCVGPAVLLDLPEALHGGRIEAEHFTAAREQIRSATRVVLNTGWHHRWGGADYFSAHPVLTRDAAQFLVDCGAGLVGVDFPSVDRPPFEAHLVLLGAGVLIVENLTNLDAVGPGVFQLAALPLKLSGRDGSPVRAVAL
jgi:kynurenine formamidase